MSNPIIKDPENWEEMKQKYEKREEEALQKVKEKRKATTKEELVHAAADAIKKRRDERAAGDHKPLKDRTVLRDPTSKDIRELRNQLVQSIAKERFQAPTSEAKELKGRVTAAGED